MPNMSDVKKTLEKAVEELGAQGGYVRSSKPFIVGDEVFAPQYLASFHRDNMTREEMNALLASARSQATQVIQACNELVNLSNALLNALVEIENEVGHLYNQTL